MSNLLNAAKKGMPKKEVDALEKYCKENGWTYSDLIVVLENSMEVEEFANTELPTDRRGVLRLLLNELGDVGRVVSVLPEAGQDF